MFQRYGGRQKGAVVTDVSRHQEGNLSAGEVIKLSEKFGLFLPAVIRIRQGNNGFDVSDASLYKNASYIIVPCKADNSVVKYVV